MMKHICIDEDRSVSFLFFSLVPMDNPLVWLAMNRTEP